MATDVITVAFKNKLVCFQGDGHSKVHCDAQFAFTTHRDARFYLHRASGRMGKGGCVRYIHI